MVLGPLRSMLKIVARYAKNPLAQATSFNRDNLSVVSDSESEASSIDDDEDGFGTYETEQLITAVAKITDLLRKCWGKCFSHCSAGSIEYNADFLFVFFYYCKVWLVRISFLQILPPEKGL